MDKMNMRAQIARLRAVRAENKAAPYPNGDLWRWERRYRKVQSDTIGYAESAIARFVQSNINSIDKTWVQHALAAMTFQYDWDCGIVWESVGGWDYLPQIWNNLPKITEPK